jgi:hypothetical protein
LGLLWLIAGCGEEPLAWYTTCGDPACGGYRGPTEGLAVCADEAEGAVCAEAGAECDLQTDCNTRLVCAVEDPKLGEGGCPISRKRHKRDVHYLDAAEVEAVRRDVAAMPLATWRYLDAPPASRPRLGFLIDDRPELPAVALDGEHVDLYGLASMAIAAVQAQERELAALRARTSALEAELKALRDAQPMSSTGTSGFQR